MSTPVAPAAAPHPAAAPAAKPAAPAAAPASSLSAAEALLTELGKLSMDIAGLVVGGIGISSLPKMFGLLHDLISTVKDAEAALPELKSLDAADAATLASQAYTMISGVVESIMGSKS